MLDGAIGNIGSISSEQKRNMLPAIPYVRAPVLNRE